MADFEFLPTDTVTQILSLVTVTFKFPSRGFAALLLSDFNYYMHWS